MKSCKWFLCVIGACLLWSASARADVPGDTDGDDDVDFDDFTSLAACHAGPDLPVSAACQDFDYDAELDVDLADVAAFQRCFSGANQPGDANCAGHVVQIENGCLRITGTPASTDLALRLQPGMPTHLAVDVGNDGAADFVFIRADFDCIVVQAGAGEDVVWIDEVNGVFTNTEITTIYGGSGNDTLLGGSGGETFIGGPGDDAAFGGAGNDTFGWYPGDGSDLVEGTDGIDTVEVNGDDVAEDFTVTANGLRVRFDGLAPTAFFLDLGACENLVLNAKGGNDTLTCTGNLAALIQITADGGPGDDTLLGSNGADVLIGGEDNDFIDGQQGADVVFFGAGDDTFQWDPGDGSDTVEGQAGHDAIIFNCSGANEIVDLSANGARLSLFRNVGTVALDADGVEELHLNLLGGTDNLNVNNLAGTDVTQVYVDLATFGGVGDALADNVNIIGSPAADVFDISGEANYTVVHLSADVRVRGYEPGDQVVINGVGGDTVNVNGSAGADTLTLIANGTQARVDATGFSAAVAVSGALSLTLNGLDGPDSMTCTGNLAGLLIPFTLDGGAGDDTILGTNGADVLIGGDDNDFVDGQQGNDVAFLGAGNDTFQWDPGDGSDTIEGQAGMDLLVFNGSGAIETIAFSANGSRLRLTRDVGTIVMDADDVEQVDLRTLGGTDNVNVNSLAGTDVVQVNVDLAAQLGGNIGDALADNVNIIGTPASDVFDVFPDAGFTLVQFVADVRVRGYEVGDQVVIDGVGGDEVNVNGSAGADTMTLTANGTQARVDATGFSAAVAVSGALSLTLNGLDGPDSMTCTGNLGGLLIPFTFDGGAGDDTILGSNGADVLIGGDDDDFIDGQQGSDVTFLGAGDDTFQWDPGDGSDTVEGQLGADTLVFNGSGAAEIIDFSANGARLRLTRNIGNIVMDADDVEVVDLQALAGADSITINSLASTDVTQVYVDLATFGGIGDAAADLVTVNGTAAADTIHVGANAGAVEVSGLSAFVQITHPEAALDTLIVNGLGGTDTITSDPGVAALIMLIINQ